MGAARDRAFYINIKKNAGAMVPAFFVGRVAGISPASCRCMCPASFCAAAEIVPQPVNALLSLTVTISI